MPKLTEDELKALLAAEKADALSAADASKLSEERERAMNYYNGDVSKDMPTVTDRSKAVSYDVSDTVEGLMPSLMEIFASGDAVVKFNAVSEEDEPQAEQETAYINHVFTQKNPGFLVAYSFVKDALLQKNGVVKVYWHESEDEERETFLDQSDDVYALFMADDEVEIVEHTEHPPEGPPPAPVMSMPQMAANAAAAPPMNQPPLPPEMGGGDMPGAEGGPGAEMMPAEPDTDEIAGYGPTHDFTIVRKRKYGCCKVEAVPPEEFGVGRTAKLGEPLDYCYHEVRQAEWQLINDGFDEAQVKDLPTASWDSSAESIARDTVNERQDGSKNDTNRPNRLVVRTEHYCRLDYDGTGAKLYRVTTGGDGGGTEILKRNGKLDVEEVPFDPFATITPFIVTHRFFGRSAADLVIDIQRIKTSMLRGIADNVYLANNQRLEVAAPPWSHEKTLDDILDNRIGGIVRVKQPGGINPIVNQPIGDFVFPVIEYFDQVREWRTGVTRMGQGLDPEALQDLGDPARAQLMNAAMEKTKLIARIFAETGFKDLFWKIHATVRKNEGSRPTVKLMGKWVTVDPREWKRRDDLTANVGLGGGSKSEQIAFWSNEISTQMEAMTAGTNLTSPGKIYNGLKKRMELAGYKDVDNYWSNPDEQPPQEPPPDPKMVEVQGKLQIAQQKAQTDAQAQQAEMQSDQQMAAAKLQADKAKMVMQMELERQKLAAEHALKIEQMQGEFALKARQIEQEHQLEREAMIVGAHVKMKTAPVRMGGKPG